MDLYREYLCEKAMYEQYGSVSSLTYEDWLQLKQKKPYTPPTTEVIYTKTEEPIACSYYEEHSGKPGHGWGDRNHEHIGPPGQNKKNSITDIWEDL